MNFVRFPSIHFPRLLTCPQIEGLPFQYWEHFTHSTSIFYDLQLLHHLQMTPSFESLLKQPWPPVWSLRKIISNQSPVRLHTTHHNPLSLSIQSIFHPPYWTFIQPISHWFVYEDTMGDCVKFLAKSVKYPLFSTCSQCHSCCHGRQSG